MKPKHALCLFLASLLLCLFLASCGAPEDDAESTMPPEPDLNSFFEITAVPNP